jgi:hypothetical protein
MTPEQIRAAAAARKAAAERKAAQAGGDGRNPDGTYGQPPEGMVMDPRTGGYVDTAAAAERMGPAQGAAASFLAGAPFVGEWADEAMGKADAALTGRNPEIATETMRQSRQQFAEANPNTALGLEIGGGIVGSIPLAVGGAGAAMGARTTAGQVARGAGLAAVAGGAEGALQGAGRANDGDRVQGAQTGVVIGASLGGALGALAPIIGTGAQNLAKRIKKLDVSTIASEFGLSPVAARTVRAALVNDDLDAAARRLAAIGDDAMLADAGPATANLLDSVSKSGGMALRVTRDAVEDRAARSGVRLTQRLDDILGQSGGVKSAARDISQRTSAARQAAYQRAYSSPIDYAAPAGRKIESVLGRIPTRTLNRAVQEANDAMQAEGLRNLQIMAQIGDDGAVRFVEMPNVQQLDFIKRALGDIAQDSKDQFGRLSAEGIRAQKLARDLRDSVGDAVPSYRGAVKIGGDKIAEDQALDLGRRLLARNTTLEDAQEIMRGASVEAREAAKRGLRENIENTLSNVRRTITDPNTDAREAMTLVKDLSSRANMAKARLVLGKDAPALFDELEKAEAALALRAAVARSTETAIRIATQRQVRDEMQPGLLRRVLGKGGNPLDAARELTETVAGIDPRTMGQNEQALMAEIAQALTGLRGAEAERALVAVNQAMQGQPIKDAEAALIGRLVAGTVGATGYQSGMQSLERQLPR